MKLKNPFFKLSKKEQKIHAVIWIIILVAINVPEWAVALGPFHSDDYSLIIPSIYGIILKTYLVYGCAFIMSDLNPSSTEKRLAQTFRLFLIITIIETVLDTGYFALHYWNISLEAFTEIIMGQSLMNFSFFYLPSLMFGFVKAWFHEPKPTKEPVLIVEDECKKTPVKINKLTHVERQEDHCVFYASEKHIIYKTIEEIQNELPRTFIRCHESYIVNAELIVKQIGNELVVGGFILPIGPAYRENLKLAAKQDMLHPIA